MRTVSVFVLTVVALSLVGCQGRQMVTPTGPTAYRQMAQPAATPVPSEAVSAPAYDAPAYEAASYDATVPAAEGPNGERVIKTVVLPKGKTPYDMGMDSTPPAGVPAPVIVDEPAVERAAPVASTPPAATGPNGERVLQMVVLPKGQTPFDAGLADAPPAAE